MRLTCKKRQRYLLVYVDGWTVKKSLLYEQKLQKSLEIPIFQFPSRFKIQVDSFLTAFTVLENWMKMYGKKQGYMYLSTGVLDYSNKNDNWTITPLSHISLMLQYYFFFTSINYNEEKTSHSKKKIIKVQKRYDYRACQTMNGMILEGTIWSCH